MRELVDLKDMGKFIGMKVSIQRYESTGSSFSLCEGVYVGRCGCDYPLNCSYSYKCGGYILMEGSRMVCPVSAYGDHHPNSYKVYVTHRGLVRINSFYII